MQLTPPPPHPAPQATTFWQRIRQLQDEDVPVMVSVMAANRGGLVVSYSNLEGFIPVSHLGQVRREAWAGGRTHAAALSRQSEACGSGAHAGCGAVGAQKAAHGRRSAARRQPAPFVSPEHEHP